MASILKVPSFVQALDTVMWGTGAIRVHIFLEGAMSLLYHVRNAMQWGHLIIQENLQSVSHMDCLFSFSKF